MTFNEYLDLLDEYWSIFDLSSAQPRRCVEYRQIKL